MAEKPEPPKDEREFYNVVKFGSAVSIGAMAAFIYSIKQVNPTLKVDIGFGAVMAFLITAFVVWQVLRGIFGETDKGSKSAALRRRWLMIFGIVLTLGTVAGFVYAMRNVSSPKKMEVLQGTLLALMVLGVMGLALVKLMKFLEDESEKHAEYPDQQDRER